MIDFPASPVVGQIFAAPNGVTYQWNGTAWITAGQTVAGGGDVYATWSGSVSSTTTPTAIVFPTVVTGNSGSWLNTTTGTYTPPAGRYTFTATVSTLSGVSQGVSVLGIYKNGALVSDNRALAPVSQPESVVVNATLDANGTDTFNIRYSSPGTQTRTVASFNAFPISGIKGPPGDVGTAATGDFSATNSVNFTAPVTLTVQKPDVILSGNSGSWYDPATGRYTPPAGRYHISAHMVYLSSNGASTGYLNLYKNGVNVVYMYGVSATTGYADSTSLSCNIDANGTDYFEILAGGGVAGTIYARQLMFSAFPLAGLRGPQGPAGPAGTAATGEFHASNSAAIPVGAVEIKVIPNTVKTGNSGGWYNTTNGRYTPPEGRYYISFSPGFVGSTAGATVAWAYLRKNGVQVATAGQVPGTASWYGDPDVHGVFDANGTDYFEAFIACNQGSAAISANAVMFMAFPLAGLRGPQGLPGTNGTDGAPGTPGAGGDLPVGSVIDYAGATAPVGWLLCNGQLVSRTTYAALFTALGTLYGAGDGSTTFGIPDCRGRVVAGKETTATRLTTAISGVNGAVVGSVGGDQSTMAHTHAAGSYAAPDHLHVAGSITTPSHAHNITGGNSTPASYTSRAGQGDGGNVYDWTIGYAAAMTNYGATGAADRGLGIGGASASTGAGASQNVQPTIIMNKIIRA